MTKSKYIVSLVSFLGAMLVVADVARGDLVALNPIKDNTLYENAGGTLSNGVGIYLFAGKTSIIGNTAVRRGLLAFDIAGAIPSGTTIQSVVLTLQMSRTISGTRTVSLHRVTEDWGEGTSNALAQEGRGAAATAGDATWVHTFSPGSTWAMPGGDFSATVSASQSISGLGPYNWASTPDLVADVQDWLDNPGTNFGWILVGDESTSTTTKRFNSREFPTPSLQPLLTVEFFRTCVDSPECDDDVFCNGAEQCVNNVCEPGGDPCPGQNCSENQNACVDCLDGGDCDDLVACTDNTCVDGECVFVPNDANCPDDGVFCDGDEICDQMLGCVSAGDPCEPGFVCNEDDDVCDPSPIRIALEVVAGGPAPSQEGPNPLVSPVYLTHAGDGSGRLFVVDQVGSIRIIDNGGTLLATPFLDISGLLPPLNPGFDERGLLGLAFHPNYDVNGRFFVRYSAPRNGDANEPCFGTTRGCHTEVLSEFEVSVGDPNVADTTETVLFEVDEPQFNHDAGNVAFGPDGFLYFSLGDGGGANDSLDDPKLPHGPDGNGQNTFTALGAMIRIDVDGGAPFAIPPDNPFADGVNGLPEIYAYGFRNPYRFSFDGRPGGDGALYLGDVGQDLFEEVDIVTLGGNYGWAVKEGFHCFDPFNPKTPPAMCDDEGMIDPVMEYTQTEGGISVIGGFVYRGSAFPLLEGRYVFGDFSDNFGVPAGRLYYFNTTGCNTFERVDFIVVPGAGAPGGGPFIGHYLKGMGEDQDGELYALVSDVLAPTGTTGLVLRIVQPPCEFDRECHDGNVCTQDQCITGTCQNSPGKRYGDVNNDGEVDLFDLFCILNCFSCDFSTCSAEKCDLDPCDGDGDTDLFDLFALLNAFGEVDPCCGGGS